MKYLYYNLDSILSIKASSSIDYLNLLELAEMSSTFLDLTDLGAKIATWTGTWIPESYLEQKLNFFWFSNWLNHHLVMFCSFTLRDPPQFCFRYFSKNCLAEFHFHFASNYQRLGYFVLYYKGFSWGRLVRAKLLSFSALFFRF